MTVPETQTPHVPHTAPKLVFDTPLRVYAGAKEACAPWGSVVLDLTGNDRPVVKAEGLKLDGIPRYVQVDWPDMTTPKLGADAWQSIARTLARERTVFVHCQMGHGRTGTALAILGCLWGSIPPGMDPVDYVRRAYCREAVETQGQLSYIQSVTGRKTTQHASEKKSWVSTGDSKRVETKDFDDWTPEKGWGPPSALTSQTGTCGVTRGGVGKTGATCHHVCDKVREHDNLHKCRKCSAVWG